LPGERTETEAKIATNLVEEAKADRFPILLVLRFHLTHLDASPTASFFFGDSTLYKVFGTCVDMEL
jgi:hypothetical protein